MGDITQTADVYVPTLWMQALAERQARYPSLINSGAVMRSTKLTEIASGPGKSVDLPFWKDITDQDEAIQVENTAPTDQKITSGLMVGTILNRVWSGAASALSAQVSGTDPAGEMVSQLVPGRDKRRQKSMLATLRGAFNSLGANGAAAALLANRLDYFDETGTDATSDQILNADMIILAKPLLGELSDQLQSGCIWLHPDVLASLEIADKESFKSGVQSGLPFTIRTYRGIPLFTSSSLVRAGTTNGKVYETYILGAGVIGMGEKPQATGQDVASLQFFVDPTKNNTQIFDRTRYMFHLNGMKWVGTPAGQSATDTELAVGTNWECVYTSTERVGAVCIRTNH